MSNQKIINKQGSHMTLSPLLDVEGNALILTPKLTKGDEREVDAETAAHEIVVRMRDAGWIDVRPVSTAPTPQHASTPHPAPASEPEVAPAPVVEEAKPEPKVAPAPAAPAAEETKPEVAAEEPTAPSETSLPTETSTSSETPTPPARRRRP